MGWVAQSATKYSTYNQNLKLQFDPIICSGAIMVTDTDQLPKTNFLIHGIVKHVLDLVKFQQLKVRCCAS